MIGHTDKNNSTASEAVGGDIFSIDFVSRPSGVSFNGGPELTAISWGAFVLFPVKTGPKDVTYWLRRTGGDFPAFPVVTFQSLAAIRSAGLLIPAGRGVALNSLALILLLLEDKYAMMRSIDHYNTEKENNKERKCRCNV